LLTSSDVGAYTMKVNYSSGGQNFTQNLTFNLDKVNHRKDQLSNNTNYVVTSSIDLEMALGGEDLVVDLKNSEDFVYFGAFTDLHHTLTYDGGTYYSAGYQLTNLQKDGSSVAAGFAIDDGVLTGTVTDLEAGVYTFDVEASSGSTDTHRFTQSFTVLVTGALALSDADFSTQSSAKTALALTESAVADISRRLAKVGSYINRLETILRKNSQAVIKTKQSVGRIVDTDFSRSTIILAKQDILKKSSAEMIRLATSEKKRTLMLL
jgi:flagellin-like hook-associated protein FlgL